MTTAPAEPGFFEPGSIVRRVDAEAAILLGAGRALLMQLAHPKVAQGVHDHSDFRSDPYRRLRRTLDATYTIVYGTTSQARQAAASVRAVHRRVAGPGYRADDPDLLLWVHATLVDTAQRVHHRFLGPLSDKDAESYYLESRRIAEALGLPLDQQPPDLTSFRAYVRQTVSTLEVTPTARRLAEAVVHPPVPLLAEPAAALGRQLTIGLLPDPLRRQFGFSWDRRRQAGLVAAQVASRQTVGRLPHQLRCLPNRLLRSA